MKYKLVADVEGNVYITSSVSFQRDGFSFDFSRGDDGKLTSIAISVTVPPERLQNFAGTMGPGKGESLFSIHIGGDREIHQQLVSQLQALESSLSFSTQMSLRKIKWDSPQQEYIPEGPDDEQILAVQAFSASKKYPESNAFIQPKTLQELVLALPKYDELKIIKAFWREGMLYFNAFQYVQAFYQFFFIIEDFYAPGKSGKKLVLKEFRSSPEFSKICENSLRELLNLKRHRKNLELMFGQFNCEKTVEGLQELLFEIRGTLHHYSSRSQRSKATPFNQNDFESIALLVMHMTTTAIGYRIAQINQREDRKSHSG